MMKNRYLKNLNVGDKVKNTLTYISAFSSILKDKIVQKSADRLFQHYHLIWIYSGDKILIRCQKPREQTYNGKIFDSALEIRAEDYNSPFKFKSGTVSEIFNSDKKPAEKVCCNLTSLISGFVPEFKPYENVINQSIGSLTSTKDPQNISGFVSNLLTDINKIPQDKTSVNNNCNKPGSAFNKNGDKEETFKLVSDVYNTLTSNKPEVTITNESDDEDYEVISKDKIDDNEKEEEQVNDVKKDKEEVVINNYKDLQKFFIDGNTERKYLKINKKTFKDDFTKFLNKFNIDINLDLTGLEDIINKSKGNRIDKMSDIKNFFEKCNKNKTSNEKKEEVLINNLGDLSRTWTDCMTNNKDFPLSTPGLNDLLLGWVGKIHSEPGKHPSSSKEKKEASNDKEEEVVINNFGDINKLFFDGNIKGTNFKINEKSFTKDLTKFLNVFDIKMDPSKFVGNLEETLKQPSEDKISDIRNLFEKTINDTLSSDKGNTSDNGDTSDKGNTSDNGDTSNNVRVIELNSLDDVVNIFKEFLGNDETGNKSDKKDNSIVNTIFDYVEKYCKGDNLYNNLGFFKDLLTKKTNKNWFDELSGLGPVNITKLSTDGPIYYTKDVKTNKKKKNNKEKAKQLRIKAGMLDPIPFYKLNLPAELITELEHYQEDLKVLGFEYFYIGHTDKLIDNFSKYYDNCERKYKTSEDKFTVKINIENSGKSYPDVYILIEMNKNNKSYMNVIPY